MFSIMGTFMKVNPLYLRIVFLITATLLTRRCYSLWVKIAKNETTRITCVESDRDQSLQYPGATGLDTPEQARKQNQH